MAVETMSTPRSSLPNTYTNVTAREIDFVQTFGRNWKALMEILGIMRPIKKQNGTRLVSFVSDVTLENGNVPAGAVIPYSKSAIEKKLIKDITIEKYAKAVTIEDVEQYGADVAIEKSDEAFKNKLQSKVMNDFYTFLLDDTYAITETYANFQMAVSMAIGLVKNKFQDMDRDVTDVVVFANTLDAYAYLGSVGITTQTMFGIEYVKDVLGAKTMILSSKIPTGKVIGVPSDNINLYHADPADSDYAKLGLEYRTDGETNLIGFHAQGNYGTAVGESFALMGMALFSEYADGIAVVTINANP